MRCLNPILIHSAAVLDLIKENGKEILFRDKEKRIQRADLKPEYFVYLHDNSSSFYFLKEGIKKI